MSNRLIELEVFTLQLPFRRKFSHAAAERSGTDTVVVGALLADGTVGYGEGLPREYVTGETVESVCDAIPNSLGEYLGRVEPRSFPELLGVVDALPFVNSSGEIIHSARCAVELALLDAFAKHFHCGLEGITGWLGYGRFAGKPGSGEIRVSGVLSADEPEKVARQLRLMQWYGLRDFKLKVGCPHDEENLETVGQRLHVRMTQGRASLRVDANGAWDVATAAEKSYELARAGVCSLEQPLPPGRLAAWQELREASAVPLMADESLVSLDNANELAEGEAVDLFNIRLSKNGGLLPAIKMAALAEKWNLGFQLGAMVGESGILAAAGQRFLQLVPGTMFTEIGYGTFLLDRDIVRPGGHFRYGGRLKRLQKIALGIDIDTRRIHRFLRGPSRKIGLA